MRVARRAINTGALAWEQLAVGRYRKLLNGNPEEGPHTLLLRSEPRAPGPASGQYHPADEEFFCLDGDFTFDGSTWFRAGSYAFYPAYFVHGTKVHVRGGYVVYLRLSGPSELFKVERPASDVPYYFGEGQIPDYALQLVDATEPDGDSSMDDGSSLLARQLHRSTATGRGSTLLTMTRGGVGEVIEVESSGCLEVFTVSGSYMLADGGCLMAHTYHCETGLHSRVTLQCSDPGKLLVSHDGHLRIKSHGAKQSGGSR